MSTQPRDISVLKDEGSFLLVKITGQEQPGVALSAGYLVAIAELLVELRSVQRGEIHRAMEVQERLVGLLQPLFDAQARHAEPKLWQEIEQIKKELAAFAQCPGDDDGPRKA